jgi:hypothetical protein
MLLDDDELKRLQEKKEEGKSGNEIHSMMGPARDEEGSRSLRAPCLHF